MGEGTKIEWCDHTVNFWWGCTKVDASCAGCYAERDAKRYGKDVWGPKKPRMVSVNAWKLARRLNAEAAAAGVRASVFTNSMADMFEDDHPVIGWDGRETDYLTIDQVRRDVFAVIEECANLDFLLLTKRPQNILGMVPATWLMRGAPANVVFGASAGTPDDLCGRLGWLIEAGARLRARTFVSLEPLIEPIEPEELAWTEDADGIEVGSVIVGGESGPNARPMRAKWVRAIRDACIDEGVKFFFKQWGEHDATCQRVGKKRAGRELDGRTWDELAWPVGALVGAGK
jgi:protein gp37